MLTRLLLPCIVLLAALGFSRGVLAQTRLFTDSYQYEGCDEAIVKSVGDHFKLDHFSDRLVTNQCKPWPTDKSRMIAAFAYHAGEVTYDSIEDRGFRRILLVLTLVDTKNKKIISSYKDVIEEDGSIRLEKLMIDTARYRLSQTTRAFALRLNIFPYMPGADGEMAEDLNLFVISGKELRPVLGNVMNRYWFINGKSGGGYPEGEEPQTVDANILISVEKTSTNGFADLRFSVKSNANKKPPSMVVKYNGENYDLTAWNNAFDTWWMSVLP